MPMTLEQAQAQRHKHVEHNQDQGVIDYESKERKSEAIYEVTEGYKYLPGGQVLGPGNRFHPTERQVMTGALRGKARELTATEYRDLKRSSTRVAGADIGVRSLPMAEGTVDLALAHGLTERDFEGVEPEGSGGRYTKAQVERMIAEREA